MNAGAKFMSSNSVFDFSNTAQINIGSSHRMKSLEIERG